MADRETAPYIKMKKQFAKNIEQAEKALRIKFKNKDLLLNALTHKSYLAEKADGLTTNERLEFLGDAVLGLIITRKIFDRFPDFSEGDLAKLRANIVNSQTLADIAESLSVGKFIIMGRGTEQAGGRSTVSILENTLEALIGSIYLDKDLNEATKFISKNFDRIIDKKAKLPDFADAKTALQEKAIDIKGLRPLYRIVEEKGPFHDRTFVSQVKIGSKIYGTGEGKSKKKAEQQAALQALKQLARNN